MKDRPIIFAPESVRAILDGSKTQTRQVVKPQPPHDSNWLPKEHSADPGSWIGYTIHGKLRNDVGPTSDNCAWRCPFGQPGDRLWVRETWKYVAPGSRPIYRSDVKGNDVGSWLSPLYMPRWASRLTLELTDVRVERVQEITPGDCEAEGIVGTTLSSPVRGQPYGEYRNGNGLVYTEPTLAFAALWDEIAKRGYGWDTNPWVWCLSFRRLP